MQHRAPSTQRGRPGRRALGLAALAAGAQYVPSTVALGQWTSLRSLPGRWCRWQGPPVPAVALTFDDGPHPEATPAVLDRLDQLGLRGTFFMLGASMEEHPELVGEVVRRGHQVATHGYRHRHHLARSPRWVVRDLQAATASLSALGIGPRWYRPTYGQATGTTLVAARRLGLEPVLWSSWGREWTTTDADEVAARIGRRLGPGAIVLLHDADGTGTPGMWRVGLRALGAVAADLEGRGLRAVTLDELVDRRPAPPVPPAADAPPTAAACADRRTMSR